MSKVSKFLSLIFGIFMVVSGFYCLFNPLATYSVLGWILGFDIVFASFSQFSIWNDERKFGVSDGLMLFGAIMSLVFGLLVLAYPSLQMGIDVFIAYYVACWLVVDGIIFIVRAAKIHQFHKDWNTRMLGSHWYVPLIIGILMIIFGVLSIMNPNIIAASIGLFMSLGVIFTGVGIINFAVAPAIEY